MLVLLILELIALNLDLDHDLREASPGQNSFYFCPTAKVRVKNDGIGYLDEISDKRNFNAFSRG